MTLEFTLRIIQLLLVLSFIYSLVVIARSEKSEAPIAHNYVLLGGNAVIALIIELVMQGTHNSGFVLSDAFSGKMPIRLFESILYHSFTVASVFVFAAFLAVTAFTKSKDSDPSTYH